jgi:hypothetical protein
MTKITFEDLPSTNTPINASNLNAVQDNVDTAKLDKTGGTISGNLAVTGTLKQNNKDVLVEISGSWIPAINTLEGAVPTISYTYQQGNFKKIGKIVFINFFLRGKITALNGTNNYAMITGLPFTIDSNIRMDGNMAINIGQMYDLINDMNNPKLWLGGTNYIRIQNNTGSGAGVFKITSGDYFDIAGSGWYIAE